MKTNEFEYLMKQKFHDFMAKGIRRALSLLDRDFASTTFGCFDKSYWHYKRSSFPNAMMQNYAYSLAEFCRQMERHNEKSPFLPEFLANLIDRKTLKDQTLN